MYNQSLMNFYIRETNRILDWAEDAVEKKNGYMLASVISDIGSTWTMVIKSKNDASYNEKFTKDLKSFEHFFSELTYQLADFITIQ